jgi:serine/threonine protein kinase
MTFEDPSSSDADGIADADRMLGKVIAGNFRVLCLIGSGAMGNVYQCEQLSLGKAVAVKVLHAHLMSDEKLVRRFQREAKSASRLNHPNSIQIIDSGRDPEGILYIAMELLSGRDLAQVIREDFPLPLPRVKRIMSQVLSALDEAHAQGVIHRDLKPSNIMLIERRGEADFVKVCDYGIAKAQFDDGYGEPQMLTIQGLVCGTPEYMSPEQARGEPLDGRTDLYSAAVILFQMVTGDIPFHGNTPIAIVSRHLSEIPVLPSSRRTRHHIPADLDDLILRGLAKSRDLRPASAALFRQEVENIGTGRLDTTRGANAPTLPASNAADKTISQTTEFSAAGAALGRRGSGRTIVLGIVLSAIVASVVMIAIRSAHAPTAVVLPTASAPSSVAGSSGARPPLAPALTPPSGPPAPVSPAAAGTPEESAATPGEKVGVSAPHGASTRGADPPASRMPSRERLAAAGVRRGAGASNRPGRSTLRTGARAVVAGPSAAAPGGPPAPSAAASAGEVNLEGHGEAHGESHGKEERPAAGSPREQVAEAEKLLGQGEVAQACKRGEDIKVSAARFAGVYRFLGKCYMRSGNTLLAKDNYRRYLDLSPNAPDALFIESILK